MEKTITKLMGTIGVRGVATLVAAVVAGGVWGQAMTNATMAAGPRDTYSVTITWNDGSTRGPYAIQLRVAMDISALPATALAAVPTFSTAPVATLSSSGLLSAATTVNFQGGAFPAGVSLGELSIQINHQMLGYGFLYDGIVPAAGLPQSKTICTPYFTGGLVDIQVTRHDIFGNPYFSNIAMVNL